MNKQTKFKKLYFFKKMKPDLSMGGASKILDHL